MITVSILRYSYEQQLENFQNCYNILTNSLEESPSLEVYNYSASQEIPSLLWNPNVPYRIHNSPPLVSILSQMTPVSNFSHYSFKIHFNIIFPFTPLSS
jgi:hypothetical protein